MLDSCGKTSAHMLPHVNFNFDSHEEHRFGFTGVQQDIFFRRITYFQTYYCLLRIFVLLDFTQKTRCRHNS